MALVPQALKKAMEQRLISALAREMGGELSQNDKAKDSHKKLAAAISDIALDIIECLLKDAQVAPGIPTAGSPASQVTTSPGKLI